MNVLIISSSPNVDGLTAACARAAVQEIQLGGGKPEEIRLNDLAVGMCHACDNGWGTCQKKHECQEVDDFQSLHAKVRQADAYVLVTPVYWGDLSESAKAFTDRLRRCEATRGEESALFEKPVICVAAAGDSGNGTLPCLSNMERWIQHVHARAYELLAVRRWSREYMLKAIQAAAQSMVQEYSSSEVGR